tara:strand:- start:947 stop:1057 length:111 start_codon:yes stop_codon:yes gene_type:complete
MTYDSTNLFSRDEKKNLLKNWQDKRFVVLKNFFGAE